jgi:hypothetical protein
MTSLATKRLTPEQKAEVYRARSQDVLVDFDGTLSQWSYPRYGGPTDGAREAMQELQRRGFRIIIWTARMDRSIYPLAERIRTHRELMKWLKKYGIPYDEIDMGVSGKRLAAFWIDDKVIHFCGDWDDVLNHARVMKEIEDERNEETRRRLDGGDRSGVEGDRSMPAGRGRKPGDGVDDQG